MRNRVERLRIWLLGSAGFLVVVIAAFLGSAHYLSRHRLSLPARLGINIVRETDGFTYSQWDDAKKRTLFTIHAAKEVEHADNKITLHDVSITLYGENQDRSDRIYGDDFEYDNKAGVIRAVGLVNLDLQAAQAAGGKVASSSAAAAKMLHVTTSGLVYVKSLGVASTSEPLEFKSSGMTGHATGADYSSDTGVLMLHSAVSMSGVSGKRAVAVTAATADLDNRNHEMFLTHARYVSQGQTMEAEQATLHTRPDGTMTRVEAQGNVTLEANGSTVVSQRADVGLNAKSQPQSALLTGGVKYSNDQPLRQLRGEAEEATIAFDAQAKPQPNDAVFSGAVHMIERTRATDGLGDPWTTRDLTAAKVDARLAPSGTDKPQLRDVEATGSAHLTVDSSGRSKGTRGEGRTELSADDLKAHLIEANDARQPPQLDTVVGRGHTLLRQVMADGTDQTSLGDSLDAKFRARSSGRTSTSASLSPAKTQPVGTAVGGPSHSGAGSLKSGEGMDDLLSAVQQGHVSMVRRAPAKSGDKVGAKVGQAQEDVERATAERAAYDGDLDRVTLTGGVQVSDAGSVLWANQVALDRATGDAQAVGGVKVNYAQDGSAPGSSIQAAPAEATHIVADRAGLEHASGAATFYGKPVRLWQGGSQVQAPVIQLARAEKRLTARGELPAGATQTAQVHTILALARSEAPGVAKSVTAKPNTTKAGADKAGQESKMPGVAHIASGELVYSGDLRQAEFTGGVRAETVDGTIRASEATVYLQQDAGRLSSSTEVAVPSLTGNVERMVATGRIEMEQPGRRATGEQLVYTASDQLFVLSGDCKAQPRLVDASRGTITGAMLRFHSGDDSVVVSNGAPCSTSEAESQRVKTNTRVGKDATIEKGKQ